MDGLVWDIPLLLPCYSMTLIVPCQVDPPDVQGRVEILKVHAKESLK